MTATMPSLTFTPLRSWCVLFLVMLAAGRTLAASISGSAASSPKPPMWPDQFTSKFTVRIEKYGSNFSKPGVVYYNWKIKTLRSDFIDWCLPLFNKPELHHNYTCSFLMADGNMYFVNHTASSWQNHDCCLFAGGLGTITPDWVKNCQYNGSAMLRGQTVDVWWFPGTPDPNMPCYGYWDTVDDHTPVRFFGLASIGPAILDYDSFQVGPPDAEMTKPVGGCSKQCESARLGATLFDSPWPSCG
ncbi:Hypp5190 [Branchiostoma lanceolatum]|uniref:Hypp5190 protein n=2 Tax=Branchiostoma lanceolatum TaxID=7740 RepID=A0A8K0ADX1_BRALA|nr:Hypp5190 [Branchiostoma lanceolatum]